MVGLGVGEEGVGVRVDGGEDFEREDDVFEFEFYLGVEGFDGGVVGVAEGCAVCFF